MRSRDKILEPVWSAKFRVKIKTPLVNKRRFRTFRTMWLAIIITVATGVVDQRRLLRNDNHRLRLRNDDHRLRLRNDDHGFAGRRSGVSEYARTNYRPQRGANSESNPVTVIVSAVIVVTAWGGRGRRTAARRRLTTVLRHNDAFLLPRFVGERRRHDGRGEYQECQRKYGDFFHGGFLSYQSVDRCFS